MKTKTQADVLRLADTMRPAVEPRDPKIMRFIEAYLMMAMRAEYRPAAPSDGFGNIQLSADQYEDLDQLRKEALDYAKAFDREEDKLSFRIGCSNLDTNRAFVLAIEAARVLAGGHDGNPYALQLLRMAVEEVRNAERRRKAA